MKPWLALIPTCLTLAPAGMAWGPKGHEVVARVAAAHLSEKARKGVQGILNLKSFSRGKVASALAGIANEADAIRDDRPETKNWHFVDIPIDENAYVASRDCKPTDLGDCVIQALARERAELAKTNSKRRREALLFVVHFMGDLHQPLHASDKGDRGGNLTIVKLFDQRSKLHGVWDSGIIELFDLTSAQYASDVLDLLGGDSPASRQAGDPIAWALESHTLARTNAYNIPANKKLGDDYVDTNAPVIDEQLLRGGLRLARVLNEIFP